MITIRAITPIDAIIDAISALPKKIAKPAIAKALNRAATATRKRSAKVIQNEMGVKAGALKTAVKVERANAKKLSALISNRGKRLNLIRFGAKQGKKGVRAKAWGTRRLYKGAFIGNKGRTVFARTSAERLPIKPLFGPGVAQTVIDGGIYKKLRRFTSEEFKKVLFKEVAFRMQKEAGKAHAKKKSIAA